MPTQIEDLQHQINRLRKISVRAEVAGAVKVLAVADLPTDVGAGSLSFASDGLKLGETTGNGTGVLVYFDGSAWYRASDDSVVSN